MQLRYLGILFTQASHRKSRGVLPAHHGRRSTRLQQTQRPAQALPPAPVGLSRPQFLPHTNKVRRLIAPRFMASTNSPFDGTSAP